MQINSTTRKKQTRAAWAITLMAALWLAGCSGQMTADADAQNTDDSEQTATAVEVVPVQTRAIAASYEGTAALEPRSEAQVVAKTSGVALRVLVEEGQSVQAGQTLVQLDSDQQRLRVAQVQAQVSKLQADYHRATQLAERQLVSAADLEQLRFELRNARASLDLARLELSYTAVKAPISGVLATSSIKAGNLVQINTPIFRIVDAQRLEATLNVPERALPMLRVGQPVQLRVDALPGQEFTGEVLRIAPVVDAGSGTFRVVTGVDGAGVLQAGMFARLQIQYAERADALAVARSALLEDSGTAAVFVVRDGKAQRQELRLGHIDGDWVEVLEGLQEGDNVVTAGKLALRDGATVRLIETSTPAPAAPASTESTATDSTH